MKTKELRQKSKKDLNDMLINARKNLGEQRFKVISKKQKNVREIRKTKKLIARILTLLNQEKEQKGSS